MMGSKRLHELGTVHKILSNVYYVIGLSFRTTQFYEHHLASSIIVDYNGSIH